MIIQFVFRFFLFLESLDAVRDVSITLSHVITELLKRFFI